jgi:hypothetical protein
MQLFVLGNLRYNPRVLVYEPCFFGYKAYTPFMRTAKATSKNPPRNLANGETMIFSPHLNNLLYNLAQCETKVCLLTRMDVHTTGSQKKLQIGPGFRKPQFIPNFHHAKHRYVLPT